MVIRYLAKQHTRGRGSGPSESCRVMMTPLLCDAEGLVGIAARIE